MAQTFSNMTAESSVRRKKRDKGKFMVNGDETLDAPAAQAETSVAGPSKLATVTTESTKLRSKRKVPSNADISLSAKDVPWQCVPIAQSEVSTVPPIWSKDGRFYFVAANNAVHIHSSVAPSFTRLSTLSSSHPKGHMRSITSLTLSPANPLQLITSSEDGSIMIWDWVEGRLVRSIALAHEGQVNHVCVGKYEGKWTIFATITSFKKGKIPTYKIVRVPLSISAADKPNSYTTIGRLSGQPTAIFISPRSTYLVALALNKAYTYRIPSSPPLDDSIEFNKAPCVKFVTDQNLTCGAFAPEKSIAGASNQEEWFATGDVRGVIRLWHGLGDAFRQVDAMAAVTSDAINQDKRLPTTSLHWHAHAVAAIAFTSSGAQLLSVGEESVLVQWHLASGKREYIPRLGGRPIISVAVPPGGRGAEEEWWMGLADGSVIRVGAASGQISNVGQGIRLDPLRSTSETINYPLLIHPSTKSLVVPSSHPSTIQFIDPIASTVLFDLEVAPSNRVSRRDDKELEPVSVEKVAFSDVQDGVSKWMATTEGRKGDEIEGGGMLKNLKIWKWSGDKYVVNTQSPRPHGISDITTIAFSPIPSAASASSTSSTSQANPYFLTTSIDGTAKIWHVRQAKNTEHGKSSAKKPAAIELFWAVRSTFNHRSLPITSSAFSPDRTIIALAHGSVVSLWDVESNGLLKVLDAGAGLGISRIGFVGETGRYLAGTGEKRGIILWDLLSCQVLWALPNQPSHTLVVHPHSPHFVTSHNPHETKRESQNTIISIHSVGETKQDFPLPTRIKDFCFLPSPSTHKYHFAGIAASGEIYRFGDPAVVSSSGDAPVKSLSSNINANGKTSIWQEMFGKDAFLEDLDTVLPKDHSTATGSALQQRVIGKSGKPVDIFDGPSHTLPPTSLLFDAFMDELLSGHTAPEKAKVEQEVIPGPEVIYDIDNEDASPVAEVGFDNNRSRGVDDQDIKELEVFFKTLLCQTPSTTQKTPAKPKTNGHHTTNGVNGHVEPYTNQKPTARSTSSTNGHANGSIVSANLVSKPNTPQKKTTDREGVNSGDDKLVDGVAGRSNRKKNRKRAASPDLE